MKKTGKLEVSSTGADLDSFKSGILNQATLSFANPSSIPRLRASPFSVLNTRPMSKDLYFNHDGSTTKKLLAGVDLVAELLGVTLGPKGRNVAVHNKYGPPKIVNDGDCSQRGFLLSFFLVIAAGMNPVQIARGIEKTTIALVSELRLMSREVSSTI
ncbi:TCP-1/cpn60 chaperonin family protein [Trifolium repens]|nr:TCP-1/cpn60 chaperonin family protein [Trifolium repens]